MKSMLLALALAGAAATATAAPASAAPILIAQFAPAPSPLVGAHRVIGRIVDSEPFFISVRAGDQVVPIRMHQGTVILPTGTTLVRGMHVGIDGDWDNRGNFEAYRIVLR